MYSLQKSSRLCQLPDELILTIRDHLDPLPAARACLALTCHYLFGIMDIASLHTLKTRHNKDREELLIRLAVPGYFYYYKYSILRPLSDNIAPWKFMELEAWNKWYESRWLLEDDKKYYNERLDKPHPHSRQDTAHIGRFGQVRMNWIDKYRFEYLHLQLAMERHRLGPDYGISLDNLSLIEVMRRRRSFEILVSSEARICRHDDRDEPEDFLYLRVQNCVYLPRGLPNTHELLFRSLGETCLHQTIRNPFKYTDGQTFHVNLTDEICPVEVGWDRGVDYINYVSLPECVPEGIWPSES